MRYDIYIYIYIYVCVCVCVCVCVIRRLKVNLAFKGLMCMCMLGGTAVRGVHQSNCFKRPGMRIWSLGAIPAQGTANFPII